MKKRGSYLDFGFQLIKTQFIKNTAYKNTAHTNKQKKLIHFIFKIGRTEIGFLYWIYSSILLLQIFTVGGVLGSSFRSNNHIHQNFLIWATALHLGALVCFFWTLIITALIRKFSDIEIEEDVDWRFDSCGREYDKRVHGRRKYLTNNIIFLLFYQ